MSSFLTAHQHIIGHFSAMPTLRPSPGWAVQADAIACRDRANCFRHRMFCSVSTSGPSGCAARPVTMSISHITGGGGGGLGSESAGMMRYSSGSFVDFSRLPITETLLSSHVTRHSLPGHLPPPLKTTVAYICLWSAPG